MQQRGDGTVDVQLDDRRMPQLTSVPYLVAAPGEALVSPHFALDGGEWDVDNNIWVFGDDDEVITRTPEPLAPYTMLIAATSLSAWTKTPPDAGR